MAMIVYIKFDIPNIVLLTKPLPYPRTQKTAVTGSLEWDFSDGDESSPSPPNVSVTSQVWR